MLTAARAISKNELEDALSYLPRKGVVEWRRGQTIYDQEHPSGAIHLVMSGRVKVTIPGENRCRIVVDIYAADEMFGEASFLGLPARKENAEAMERTVLMSWTTDEIEDYIQSSPKLGLALIQMMVGRCVDFEARLQSMALDKTPERIARSLLRFTERVGVLEEDGSMRIPPLTHQLLSEYVGTSREIVTFQMNHFRALGYLRYSRKAIHIYPEVLRNFLKNPSAKFAHQGAV
ncbi:MAG TPA: Crp/Fnr family transcriptional regulator [Bryobacteraceae bacterium]|jgi:CRP/FNR family transcriptional regulator|nr:Crp/Fnr family transcriptional regulator [Bryobacteraceae bacterium]